MTTQNFQIYVGTKYQGPQVATSAEQACFLFASKHGRSFWIFRAEPSIKIQDLKRRKKQ
jgi:hypothetical protein